MNHHVVGPAGPHAGQVDPRLDAETAQCVGRPDARAPEQERRLQHSGRGDHPVGVDPFAVGEFEKVAREAPAEILGFESLEVAGLDVRELRSLHQELLDAMAEDAVQNEAR